MLGGRAGGLRCSEGWLSGISSGARGGGRAGGMSSFFSPPRGGMRGAGSLGRGFTSSSSISTGNFPVRGRQGG